MNYMLPRIKVFCYIIFLLNCHYMHIHNGLIKITRVLVGVVPHDVVVT